MDVQLVIRPITTAKTFPLRLSVLRPGRPLAAAEFPGDNAATTHHFGAFRNRHLLGIASLFLAEMPEMPGLSSVQLRGMAVAPDTRRAGLGRALTLACIAYAKKQGAQLLWCNARTCAVGFYQKLGLQLIGAKFHIPDVGPHFRMWLPLAKQAGLTAATDQAIFFASQPEFRQWLERNHDKARELLVGFHKRHSGKPSITWPQAVDEALCFGWIDGVRRSLGDSAYTIRFTPRKTRSIWSAVNIKRAKQLEELGLMNLRGLAVFRARDPESSGRYSYERQRARFNAAQQRAFRANKKAWAFFKTRPPWYQRTATWWVIQAKKEETQSRRLSILIAHSARSRTIPPLTRPSPR
jgi:uncharacterized protein YdeI (YjbR/CyaY-like superfamily)/GNAT superfamily N-acetyltransferase